MAEIKHYEAGARASRVTEYKDMLYFTGHVAAGKQPTIEEQTQALLQRLEGLLEDYGSDKNHILSASIYLRNMEDADGMNSVWDKWIDEGCAPARLCVQAQIAEGYLLEIALIAAKK